MLNLLPGLTLAADVARKNFVNHTNRVSFTQEQFLLKLLQDYKNTVLGKEYKLQEIKTIEQFQQRLPVAAYSQYRSYMDRIAAGEANVLTPDQVCFLNRTSGSTGDQKMIPVTRRFQNKLGLANLVSIGFLNQSLRLRGQKFGKGIATNPAVKPGVTSGGIEYGSGASGVLRMGSVFYKQLFVQPFDALKIEDTLSRCYICLLFALQESPRGFAGNFPMVILLICRILEQNAASLIDDIERGTIASWLDLPAEIRSRLEQIIKPNTQRATQLRKILDVHGKLTPILAWPDLAFYGTARGGTSDFYLERFPAYFGETPGFGFVFSSAEGTFSIYPDLNTDGSVLAVSTGFFEFIPQEEWEQDHPRTLLAEDVKVGEYYRLLVTNHSGFYRYDIGDIFEVVGFYNQAPLLVFCYRRGGILSATSEKTTEYHVTRVMQQLQQKFNVALEDFCVTLSADEVPSRYLLNIELSPDSHLAEPYQFIQCFDDLLKEVNRYYGVKRETFIPPPRLRFMAEGSFDLIRERYIRRGIPAYQLKFPHISEDRDFMAGLNSIKEWQLL